MTRTPPTVRGDDAKDRERPDDEARARREADILVKIADIEKAVVSAQLATVGSENDRLEDLRVREAQAHEETRKKARLLEGELQQLRHDLEIAQSALNALRREHEEVKRDLSGRLDEAHRRTRRLASVAAAQTGRAFIAAAFEGTWPLRRWLLRRRVDRLRQSGLVDPAWYLANNTDVAEAGMDPVLHYLHHGAAEGRAPNPAFEDMPGD